MGHHMDTTSIAFDNSYARDMAGFYVPCQPEKVPEPKLLYFNSDLAQELALGLTADDPSSLAAIFRVTSCPRGRSRSPRPTLATSSASSRPSSATAAPC